MKVNDFTSRAAASRTVPASPLHSTFIIQPSSESMLTITDLHASVGDKEILKGISLTVNAGEVHAIMGPNGSGKSTLAQVIAGHPGYEVTGGTSSTRARTSSTWTPRARAGGVFLAFQYPVEIPGVSNAYFLRAAYNELRKARGEEEVDPMEFLDVMEEKLKLVEMDATMMQRSVNAGFSGGEKKRNEILQMAVLEPKLAILDETDSGLDIDALRIVADGCEQAQAPRPPPSWSRTTSACSTTSCPTSCTCWPAGAS
jgi:Fe-S cluster assembly ATP-binding protein